MKDAERVVAAGDVELLGEGIERGGGGGELAGQKHLPEVSLLDQAVQLSPCIGREGCGDGRGGLHLDQRLGDDDQLAVLAGNVEVMDLVGEVVAVAEDAAARADGEMEGEAALVLVAARVHARLHHALAHRIGVEELGQMTDRIVHAPPG